MGQISSPNVLEALGEVVALQLIVGAPGVQPKPFLAGLGGLTASPVEHLGAKSMPGRLSGYDHAVGVERGLRVVFGPPEFGVRSAVECHGADQLAIGLF